MTASRTSLRSAGRGTARRPRARTQGRADRRAPGINRAVRADPSAMSSSAWTRRATTRSPTGRLPWERSPMSARPAAGGSSYDQSFSSRAGRPRQCFPRCGGVGGRGDWTTRSERRALGRRHRSIPPVSGLSLTKQPEEESEEGSKEERVAQRPHLPRPVAAVPPQPPADAPSSSPLTGILRSPLDSRNRTFGRCSEMFPPRLD
jgi:hypothetical protein